MNKTRIALAFSVAITTPVYALDHVETLDGGMLTGTIKSISETSITLVTSYAGELVLKREQIKGFNTESPVFVRLKSGTTLAGQVSHNGNGELVITGEDATMTTNTVAIEESWLPDHNDPQIVRAEKQRDALKRKWSYDAGVDIAGKKGNSDEFSASVNLGATLKSKEDTLKFYASVEKASKNGTDTSDEMIFGSEYTAYFTDPWGWYVRGEIERDDFENLDLRTLVGGGLNYRVFNDDTHSLELRSGVGYRYESFNNGLNESSPTLDFGLDHHWQFASWADMTNKLTYAPAFDDFGDYLITHDSGINIPIGFSQYWNLRLGLRNDYKSLPTGNRKHLDSSYYSRLQLKW
jgi:putative salt-induced outer membrane protein YdiY